NTTTPHHLYLYHFCAVAETHMTVARSCEIAGMELVEWVGERALRDPRQTEPERRYRLYQRFDRVVCVPDAGLLLKKGNLAKVYYLEQDRDTTRSAERVAASKCGGYAALFEARGHYRHFPDATWDNFNVLLVAPSPRRRDNLRAAVTKKPRGGIWK